MKKVKACLIAFALLIAPMQAFAEELINCVVPENLGSSDNLSRGFYIDFYPGETLDQVYLFFESNTVGSGSYRLTVRDNTFDGELLGTAETDYGFSMTGLPVPVLFDFGRISITSGSRITFAIEQLSGDANTFYSTLGAAEGCPVIETNGTTPPLSTDRGVVHAIIIGASEEPMASTASLENPGDGANVSGINTISGWVCDANVVEVEIDGSILVEAAYGTPRADTMEVCGDANNGFGLLVNWAIFGDGAHTIRLLADGIEVASGTFTVTTLGVPFLVGADGSFILPDFPEGGQTVTVEWSQSQQGFVITEFTE